ncbi:N-acetyldiaminopimelate deacetylase [Weissella viridescens]|uniref:N-acetyldiaminopimelate deacetylase n=1 Tax=Weissella viridescens TaxID=1629 RepID=UPI001C7E14A3|nr:N-acetyldiaminopimelate deacetylase [Weissella viridescens]MBX4172349.1 N-acetyldiaminopimelate deacetylase [Weissella viridescens]
MAEALLDDTQLVEIRRDLHQIPELALQETETHDYLKSVISDWQVPWMEIRDVPELPTAILVRFQGSDPQRTLGYRTDIDGLPIDEATGLPFASKHPGKMHACGHDMHMTVALGVLHYYTVHQPKDNLVFLFQPAEEEEFGGKKLYDLGVFNDEWRPDEFYGLHDNPALPAGQIATRQGTLFAGSCVVRITFSGAGGHAAMPHLTNDALLAGASFVSAVQSIVSRNLNPVDAGVVTFGSFHAGGTVGNIIASEAKLIGTMRGLTQKNLEMMMARMTRIANGVAETFNVDVDLELEQGGYQPVENDPETTARFIDFMENADDVDFSDIDSAMTAEDFGYLLHQIPGTMFWLGVNDRQHNLHQATLSPDEAALVPGVRAITEFLDWRMTQA